MSLNTLDWPWTKTLYDMQWNYPYIADIAEVPTAVPNVQQQMHIEEQVNTTVPDVAHNPDNIIAPASMFAQLKPYLPIIALAIGAFIVFKAIKK